MDWMDWVVGSKRASKDVVWSALGDAQTQHPRIEVVLDHDDLSNHRILNIVEVVLPLIQRSSPTLHRLTMWSTYRPVWPWFRVVTRIATSAPTNFASLQRKFGLTHLFGHLAETWLPGFRKSLHALTTTSILRIKPLFVWDRASIKVPLHLGSILWVLASTHEIFNWAPLAAASLTSLGPNFSSTLRHWHHTNTGFFVTLGMFTLSAAVFEPLPAI